MLGLKKKQNKKSEEHFHDEWADSVSVNEIDVIAQFEGITSPEYKEVIKSLGKLKGKKILNLGCGLGEEPVYLALNGADVTAIDISGKMIDKTRELAKKYKVDKKIKYYKESAEKMTFRSNSFDAVIGCNLLHHVDISKTIRETYRVLKPNGIAAFSEPLAYNPIVNIYRIMAHKVRTDHEHPLHYSDIEKIKDVFPNTKHKEFHLLTLFIFIWFFFGERQSPNKVRYWKKIINQATKYENTFRKLQRFDKRILKYKFFRRYCWVSVIVASKT